MFSSCIQQISFSYEELSIELTDIDFVLFLHIRDSVNGDIRFDVLPKKKKNQNK